MGACLGGGRATFECILYGLGGLGSSPEGRTGGGGMGRAARAGVRVGLFVCVCLCRERPPCEGCFPSVTAEGSEVKVWGFPSVSPASCGLWRHGQGGVPSGVSTFVRKKVKPEENEVFHTPLKSSQPTGELDCRRLGPSCSLVE